MPHIDVKKYQLPIKPMNMNLPTAEKNDDDVAFMSIKELKAELQSYNMSTESYFDKTSLVEAVKNARKEEQQCANCGKGEEESASLKLCNGCKMVKYCSRECQKAHRPQHKTECMKRAAELHEEALFKDHPPRKDCPICMIPMPVNGDATDVFKSCCGNFICIGCSHAMRMEAKKKGKTFKEDLCPYCNTPEFSSDKELIKRMNIHMERGNADVISKFGAFHVSGSHGITQDYTKANELFLKAGELGCADAYYNLAKSYEQGLGVDINKKRAKYYYERSAMMGSVVGRCLLGAYEAEESGRRALKHIMVAARAGHTISLNIVKEGFGRGHVTKEEYAATLRAYQIRHDEMKSDAREKAAPIFEDMRRRGIV